MLAMGVAAACAQVEASQYLVYIWESQPSSLASDSGSATRSVEGDAVHASTRYYSVQSNFTGRAYRQAGREARAAQQVHQFSTKNVG